MKLLLLLAFTVAATNIVMGDDDSDYDYEYEPLGKNRKIVKNFSCYSLWKKRNNRPKLLWISFVAIQIQISDCTAEGAFTCSAENGDACIPEYYVCDTMIDCEDGSDEADCGMYIRFIILKWTY